MRTIEEIKTDLSENNGMLLIQSVLTKEEKIKCLLKQIDLGNELIVAQDAEIARLRQQCEWQPIETAPRDGTVIELIAPMSEYPRIGKWVDFPSFVFRGVREPGISKWVDANLTLPEIKNPTLWRPIPPVPKAQEGSHE